MMTMTVDYNPFFNYDAYIEFPEPVCGDCPPGSFLQIRVSEAIKRQKKYLAITGQPVENGADADMLYLNQFMQAYNARYV